MKTHISIIIPTYNSTQFLDDTLNSVRMQSIPPRDLTVVDDASTDATCETVESFARSVPFPVQLIRLPTNSGSPVRPMNIAFGAAAGKFITILDHDDILTPDAVEICTAAVEGLDDTISILSADFQRFDDSGILCDSQFSIMNDLTPLLSVKGGSRPAIISPEAARTLLLKSWCLPIKGAIAKAAWEAVGGFSERYRSAWDCDFVWRVTERFGIAIMNLPTVRVRVHGGSLSGNQELVSRELIQVYKDMTLDTRNPVDRRRLRRRINCELFDLSYGYYCGGRYLNAAKYTSRLLIGKLCGI